MRRHIRSMSNSPLSAVAGLRFLKMHGAGNDFVVLDARRRGAPVVADCAQALADRATGVGCDQLIILTTDEDDLCRMTIFNPDGSESGACGNATRCVARLLLGENEADEGLLRTAAGALRFWRAGPSLWGVEMGAPTFDWRAIPLAAPYEDDHIRFAHGPFNDPTPVNIGNPHVVFFVDALDGHSIAARGPLIENDPMFPERTNVGFALVEARDSIRLRVWERGAGLTRACGSGACAALVAAAKRGLTDRAATLTLDGGALQIKWRERDDQVEMIGPAVIVFAGVVADDAAPVAAISGVVA